MFESADILNFIKTLHDFGGYDFFNYSEKSFTRRVEKVMMDYKLDIPGLISRIKTDRNFLEQVVRDITVNTTELFRDPQVWHAIKYRILPRLASKREINIWHAGCSTGLEVYSMIILLNEMGMLHRSHIYATDLNTEVLQTARKGVYSYRSVSEYLDNFNKVLCENPYNFDEHLVVTYEKYFELHKARDIFKVKQEFLDLAEFKKHDLVNDPNPFDVAYDIILCRNVLIYFNNTLQNKLFMDFWKYLDTYGSLVLGIHESIIGPPSAKYEKRGLIYNKKVY